MSDDQRDIEERRKRYAESIQHLRDLRELGKRLNVSSERYDDDDQQEHKDKQ